MRVRTVVALAALAAALPARAALFDDDEARRQIADVRRQVEAQAKTLERIESEVTDKKALLELVNQLEALKQEIAGLRGQIEVVANRVEGLDKRQKDLYVDLDTRLRKFESAKSEQDKVVLAAQAEQQAYEAGLAQFKANNYGAAIQSLQSFLTSYPQSQLAPSAQYWVGNAHYALREYKNAIAAQQKLISIWPDSAKAPDALLNIASSQAEMGDAKSSRSTLQTLVAKYPNSPAAEQAKQRLAKK
ncbi:MAG TPA: tol-pal system protein YbgF [Burkholderiales bacterium]|nr:tol-pal system protein YbgF [Burkholderiales bacterium]